MREGEFVCFGHYSKNGVGEASFRSMRIGLVVVLEIFTSSTSLVCGPSGVEMFKEGPLEESLS